MFQFNEALFVLMVLFDCLLQRMQLEFPSLVISQILIFDLIEDGLALMIYLLTFL